MEKNPSQKKAAVAIPVTRARLTLRTQELAVRAGRDRAEVSQLDYEQAKRELMGEVDVERQLALIDV